MRAKRNGLSVKFASFVLAVLLVGLIGYFRFHPSAGHVQNTTQNTPPVVNATPSASKKQPTPHVDAGLQQIVDNWAAQHSFSSSVIVTELDGPLRTSNRNQNTAMVTASTYKIFVAYAALHEVEQGKYTMQTVTRTGQTVQAALSKMILQSDNSSAEALGFLVGWDTIDSLAASVGATHTDINNYDSSGNATNGDKHSTASDLALMVTKLQQGSLLSAPDTQTLLGLMKTQVWRERVPAGVPNGVAVADKPGWLSDVENDAAIVYGPKSTYLIVVMTNGSTTQPLADLSQQVYNYLET